MPAFILTWCITGSSSSSFFHFTNSSFRAKVTQVNINIRICVLWWFHFLYCRVIHIPRSISLIFVIPAALKSSEFVFLWDNTLVQHQHQISTDFPSSSSSTVLGLTVLFLYHPIHQFVTFSTFSSYKPFKIKWIKWQEFASAQLLRLGTHRQ